MTSPVPKRALALLLLLSAACPGQSDLTDETGEKCWDGKDNDGDGRVDCNDPDCARIVVCLVGFDGGVKDLWPKKDGKPTGKDSGVPPADKAPPPPDKGPPSSYSAHCTWSSRNPLCADNKTHCIQALVNQKGFCTYPCGTMWEFCQPGPAGTFSACSYIFNGKNYCAFLCRFMGKDYPCPPGLTCHPYTGNQSYCWP